MRTCWAGDYEAAFAALLEDSAGELRGPFQKEFDAALYNKWFDLVTDREHVVSPHQMHESIRLSRCKATLEIIEQ